MDNFLYLRMKYQQLLRRLLQTSCPSTPKKSKPEDFIVVTPTKTRRDCFNCSSVKKINVSLKRSVQKEKSKQQTLKQFAAEFKRKINLKAKNQRLKRQELKIKELKSLEKCKQIKINHLLKKNKKISSENESLMKTCETLTSKNEKLAEEVKKLKEALTYRELELMENPISDQKDEEADTLLHSKTGKAYSVDVREFVYNALTCDVPVKQCGILLDVVAKVILKRPLSHVPAPSTCAQMAYELGVLTTVQVMEFIFHTSDNVCLSWDATTIDGCHVNEVHLTVAQSTCLVLVVKHLPGGKTADYVNHIVSALSEAADVYARYSGKATEEVFSSLKKKITATLSDRAPVNACVTRQLRTELDSELVQLHCNIHPLDSCSRHARKSLAKLDQNLEIKRNCCGSDGTAANLINAVSVLRFKDGTGDPVGFKNMLRHHNLPAGTFVRYVGNRMHILFHLAGILVLHWTKLKEFLQMQCTAAGLLRSRLLKDLQDERIMAQVWALGVVGKIFSGPWMTKFYSSDMSNLEMRPFILASEEQLRLWIECPSTLARPKANIFGEPLCPLQDEVLTALNDYACGEETIQFEALKLSLVACHDTIKAQFKSFFEVDTEIDIDCVSSAPTHNMASERALGCLDKMWRRAPIATGGFLSGKVRSKMNKSTKWLESQPADVREKLVTFAIKEAKQVKSKLLHSEQAVKNEISKRRQEVSLERSRKDRHGVIKSLKSAFKEPSLLLKIDCSVDIRDRILSFLKDPSDFVGTAFLHSTVNFEYYGRIINVERRDGDMVISYWGMNESESNSVDHNLPVLSFFADAILGCITFM